MDESQRLKRRALTAERARKQLANKSWPEVVAVFQYENPRATLKSAEETDRIKRVLATAGCANMVVFLELVRFEEAQHSIVMSYNLSLRSRNVSFDTNDASQNALAILMCPDILVGTRRGIEGAMDWLSNVSKAVPDFVPESLRVMDNIFGEAVEMLKGASIPLTLEDMLYIAKGEQELPEPGTPSRN